MAAKPVPPSAAEVDADLRRQLEALGMAPITGLPFEDRVYAALVEVARETKQPVSVTTVARKLGIAQSTATRYCQLLVSQNRAFSVPIDHLRNRYVPRVV